MGGLDEPGREGLEGLESDTEGKAKVLNEENALGSFWLLWKCEGEDEVGVEPE